VVRVRPAADPGAWRRRLVPWEGRAAPADLVILVCIAVVLVLGFVVRLLTPFLIANEPVLLELLSGDLIAVGAAAAFARVGAVPLWAAIVAGVIGMIKFDWLTWWAGKRWGEGFIRMIATTRQAKLWSERARVARPSLMRLAVILAMLPGVPTAVVFVIAGMSGMRLVTFLVLDAVGATAMTGLVAGLGFALGQNAVDVVLLVDRYASAVSISLIALAITVPLVRGALRRIGERRRRGASSAQEAPHPPGRPSEARQRDRDRHVADREHLPDASD
jgi:membrane protein DedA with SNARE-associated domain